MGFSSKFAALLMPFLASAKLGTGIRELTADNFDNFVAQNDKVMVDFVKGTLNQTEELLLALRTLREFGSKVPLARLDVDRHPELAKRFVPLSCDETSQKCASQFPQLLWFSHGQPTHYHRNLKNGTHIASFVVALDRDLVSQIESEADVEQWNRLVLFRGERTSEMYKALERVAAEHMDTLAIAHLEEKGTQNVSWIVEGHVVDEYSSTAADVDSIEAWARHHLIWSEDVPPANFTEDGAVVVVGKTFEQLVMRPDSDVFLFVFAPWCGFSRKIMPVWAELARATTSVEGLSIAKMDGTRNSIATKEFHWTTYPTIVFFRAGDTKPIPYEGERSLEALKAFAESASSFQLSFSDSAVVLLQQEATYRRGDRYIL